MTMRLCLIINLFVVLVIEGLPIRPKRSSGKATIPVLIRAPKRNKPGETTIPPPGWTHCIRSLNAGSTWRFIDSTEFTAHQTTQFQCTWMIQTSRFQGIKAQKQIQISIQKLNLGSPKDIRCIRQFVEIIDQGKSQGRYCDRNVPGDYITLGGSVRLDVQGVDFLANEIKSKKNPFVIAIKAVPKLEAGFRKNPTKIKGYDPDSSSNIGIGKYPKQNSNEILEDNDDEEDKGGILTIGGLVGIIICCLLVACLVVVVVIKKCCFVREKTDKDKPHQEEEMDSNIYPPSYSRAVSLPQHSSTTTPPHYGHYPPKIEVVIKNETMRNQKASRGKSKSPKKNPVSSNSKSLSTLSKRKNEINKQKKHMAGKTERRPSIKINAKNEKTEVKHSSKLPSSRYPSAASQIKTTKAQNHKESGGKRRKRRRREKKDDTPANRAQSTKPQKKKRNRPSENAAVADKKQTTKVRPSNRSRGKNKQINKTKLPKPKQNKPQDKEKKSTKKISNLPKMRQKSA